MSVITLVLGTSFCLIDTLLVGFGDHSILELVATICKEVIAIGILTSLTQTSMHISKSTGSTIVAIVMVFLVIGNLLPLLGYVQADIANALQKVWLTNLLDNTGNIQLGLTTRLINFVGVLIYQTFFLTSSVKVFEKEQI